MPILATSQSARKYMLCLFQRKDAYCVIPGADVIPSCSISPTEGCLDVMNTHICGTIRSHFVENAR